MLQLNQRDPRPIYEQVVDGIEQLIARGVWEADDQLPSVRQLAIELSVNPNTIQKAYTDLLHRGIIYSVRGRGNFVAGEANVRGQKLEEIRNEMVHLLHRAKELGATREECEQILCSLKEVIEDG